MVKVRPVTSRQAALATEPDRHQFDDRINGTTKKLEAQPVTLFVQVQNPLDFNGYPGTKSAGATRIEACLGVLAFDEQPNRLLLQLIRLYAGTTSSLCTIGDQRPRSS